MFLNNAQKREMDAFVREHVGHLRQQARYLTRNAADAEDLVQDTLEKACRYRTLNPHDGNERGWVSTILFHRFIDLTRRRKRLPQFELIENAHSIPVDETPAERKEITGAELRDAVSQLPEPFRSAYELADVEGLRYAEVGRRLGVPIGTVATRLMRARQKLRKMLFPVDKAA